MSTYNFTTTATTFSLTVDGHNRGTWDRTTQGNSVFDLRVLNTAFVLSFINPFLSDIIRSSDTIQINSVTQVGTIPNIVNTLKSSVFYLSTAVIDVASDFADDAAAATGLIPVGGFYHTSGAVKVRLA